MSVSALAGGQAELFRVDGFRPDRAVQTDWPVESDWRSSACWRLWPRLVYLAHQSRPDRREKRDSLLALRWRVVGWLLVIELMLGQNLFGPNVRRDHWVHRMNVDSYLELFHDAVWLGLLRRAVGCAGGYRYRLSAVFGILIDNWREPAEGGQFGTVTGLSLRRMEIELFIALLVVVLAGQPAALTPLNAGTGELYTAADPGQPSTCYGHRGCTQKPSAPPDLPVHRQR